MKRRRSRRPRCWQRWTFKGHQGTLIIDWVTGRFQSSSVSHSLSVSDFSQWTAQRVQSPIRVSSGNIGVTNQQLTRLNYTTTHLYTKSSRGYRNVCLSRSIFELHLISNHTLYLWNPINKHLIDLGRSTTPTILHYVVTKPTFCAFSLGGQCWATLSVVVIISWVLQLQAIR